MSFSWHAVYYVGLARFRMRPTYAVYAVYAIISLDTVPSLGHRTQNMPLSGRKAPRRFLGGGSETPSWQGGVVQILLRSGALFATPFSAHPCRVLAHSVRIFCAFYAFSELSAKCSGCTGLLTEPLGLAWLSTEMLHLLCILRAFTCIYEPECRMRAECT